MSATPTGILFYDPTARPLSNAGQYQAGAYYQFYLTGTTTPANVYLDGALTVVANQTPGSGNTTANGAGMFIPLYLDPTIIYRVQLFNALGQKLEDTDPYIVPGPITQAAVGKALYNQTPAEIAAGVTPANYAYPPGDVRRYAFGTVGDGITDSTDAIISAFKCCTTGGSVYFQPAGVYMVHVNGAHTILVSGLTNFRVQGNNSTIRAFANDPCASNDELLYFTGCSDFTVDDLIIDGNRANRAPTPATTHNVTITGGCQRGKLRNVRSINSCMDGFFVVYGAQATQSTYPTDILFENCVGDTSYRNGLSLDGCARVTLRGGRYINSNGTAPQNGIDIEPDPNTTFGNTDIVIDCAEVTGNTGDGLELTGPGTSGAQNTRVTVRGLTGNGNGSSFMTVFTVQDLKIEGFLCGQHSAASRGALLYFGTGGVATDIGAFDLMFAPQVAQPAGNYLIFDTGVVSGKLVIDGVRCNNFSCQGIELSSPGSLKNVALSNSTVASQTILIEGAGVDCRNITVDTCAGKAFYASALTELDGFTFINAASTLASAEFDTGATSSIVRNGTVRQTAAIPAGAVGIYFNSIPAIVQNIKAVSAGTDYTASNIFNFAGGTTGLTLSNCYPDPFSTTATIAPGTVNASTTYQTTVALAGAALGDYVYCAPGVALQGAVCTAAVDSANTLRVAIANLTGVGSAYASSTWKFRVEKRP